MINYIKRHWPLLLVFMFSAALIFWRLGASSLDGNDEAIYGQVAKQILLSKDWITLHWAWYTWFDKPPLYMWLTAILFKIFGVSAFWSRFVSAAAGVGVVCLTYLLGKRLFSTRVGVAAAVILGCNAFFLLYARQGMLDTLLTFFTYLAVYGYLESERKPKWWLLVGPACGLAIMTKGAAAISPIGIVAILLIVEGRLASAVRLRLFWYGIGLGILVALPWHLAAWAVNGKSFIDSYIIYNVLNRSSTAIESHVGGANFYLNVLQADFSPWISLLPLVMGYAIYNSVRDKKKYLPLIVTMLFPFLFFTIIRTKLDWYVFPMLPALAILVAVFFREAYQNKFTIALGGLVWISFILALNAPRKAYIPLIVAAIVAVVVSALILRDKHHLMPKILTTIAFIFMIALGLNSVRYLYRGKISSTAAIATVASTHYSVNKPIVAFGPFPTPVMLFYTNRPAITTTSLVTVQSETTSGQVNDVVVDKSFLPQLTEGYQFKPVESIGNYDYGSLKPKP